jgi:uncharacterized SAM-binding protein YcdF (DUF218 family)
VALPLWVHKLAAVPVLPVGFCLVMGVVGLALKKRWVTAVGLAVLLACSLKPVADFLLTPLENAYPVRTVESCPKADAAVVLGGMVHGVRGGHVEWNEAVDRLDAGLALLGGGRVDSLVFTRARFPWTRGTDDGEIEKAEAVRRGVPPDRIVLSHEVVGNTAEEAAAVRRLMQEHGWKRIVVVTSAFHMRRAMGLMRRAGVAAEAYPVDFRRWARGEWTDWLPQAENVWNAETAVKEYAGLLYYRLWD